MSKTESERERELVSYSRALVEVEAAVAAGVQRVSSCQKQKRQ